jgi:hydroxyacylglutathione hydrolase
MRIEQLYTKCLAQGAYYLSHKGEAALIDPLREVETYAALLKEDEAELKYVFETHFHADFVSGHLDISNKSGAEVVFGPGAQTQFPVHLASDGERFTIGDWTVQLLHTPGHTLESSCYLLLDPEGKPHALFTGDTLFLGDVGRPDLAQKMDGLSMEDLAGMSYDSLRNKIMPLPDELVLYPAHGAGSACGKNMMNETVDTLGNQRKVNYALRADMSKAEFIEEVTSGLVPPPAYFPENVRLNKEGSQALEKVMAGAYRPMGTQDIQQLMTHGDWLGRKLRPLGWRTHSGCPPIHCPDRTTGSGKRSHHPFGPCRIRSHSRFSGRRNGLMDAGGASLPKDPFSAGRGTRPIRKRRKDPGRGCTQEWGIHL